MLMKRRAILLGVVTLVAAGPASAKVMDAWTRISLQFTNLARAEASDTAIGVATLTTTAAGDHLNTVSAGFGHQDPYNLFSSPSHSADPNVNAPPNGAVPGLSLNTILPVTDPVVSNGGIVSVRLTEVRLGHVPGPQGAPGVIGPVSGAIASTTTPSGGLGTAPSQGMVRICLVVPGCAGNLPLNVGATVNGVAIGGGVGGILTIGQLGMIRISLVGAPYTVKTVTAFNRTNNGAIQTFTEKGFAHGPMSGTSSTGQTSGVLQVVTTNHTTSVGVPGNSDMSGNFTRILVHFIPEPGLLLLLGSGAVGMALLGRKRIRK
jgi:hypothetical protein